MPRTRKSQPPSLKAKVAVEAIKAHKTAAQIAQMFGVRPTQVGGWKKQALTGLPDVFGNGREQMRQQADSEKDELYKQIGQRKVELDFLKKELASSIEDRRRWIDPQHSAPECAGAELRPRPSQPGHHGCLYRGAARRDQPATLPAQRRWISALHQRDHDNAERPLRFRAAHQGLLSDPEGQRRYSPPDVTHTERVPVMGNPDPGKICTSTSSGRTLRFGCTCAGSRG